VDAACAAGLSTRSLADRFPGAKVQGLDLSPHFLALAELRRRRGSSVFVAAAISGFQHDCDGVDVCCL